MTKNKDKTFEVACPDCGAMLKIDATTGLMVSHTSAPRKRMFEDLETAAQAMREHGERTESIFRQSVDAEKNKADLLEKKFAEAMRKAKDAPARASLCARSIWTDGGWIDGAGLTVVAASRVFLSRKPGFRAIL